MKPIQPFFVLDTRKYYKQIPAHPLVAHFYRFDDEAAAPGGALTVPDGATDLVFDLDPDAPTAAVCGTVTHGSHGFFRPGHTYFGARLRPGALSHLGGVKSAELCGSVLPLDQAAGAAGADSIRRLTEELAAEPDFRRQISLFLTETASLLDESSESRTGSAGTLARQTVALIDRTDGQIRLTDLEQELHYSGRHISRVFRDYTGITVKEFCRFVRFQNAIRALSRDKAVDAGTLAQDCGYYDQAHFHREFREFASMTPAACRRLFTASRFTERLVVVGGTCAHA